MGRESPSLSLVRKDALPYRQGAGVCIRAVQLTGKPTDGQFLRWVCRLRDYSARCASPLRGRPSGDQRRFAALSNPACFMSGVRICNVWRYFTRATSLGPRVGNLPAEGLLGAVRLTPAGSPFGRSTPLRGVVEPGLLYVGGSNLQRLTILRSRSVIW